MDGITFSGQGDLAGVVNLYLTCEENLYMNIWRHTGSERQRDKRKGGKVSAALRGEQHRWETESTSEVYKEINKQMLEKNEWETMQGRGEKE